MVEENMKSENLTADSVDLAMLFHQLCVCVCVHARVAFSERAAVKVCQK